MAKRNTDERDSELEEENLSGFYSEDIEETVLVELLKDVELITEGVVTGKLYKFHRGGSIVNVDKRDAEIMLNRVSEHCKCSGDNNPSPYFRIV